ncbi:hypothetical protein CYLTODRAFT_492163 [Cylindrobasidium torrendii FP15055 ss-10]|uniref:Uncharacterized protein n=1 Tax=Cylindrobasidium torrendii FP15055 ss-10 TaxID=1314674 RepID=A0A0D7B625_9AGAR|nr:hypothetical protein CYLTODRAFT_492163 [Cylindrobasidium torrendii FP15055 ss-10]
MSGFLDAFKVKPIPLERVYETWTPPPPTFTGSSTQNVDTWLATIKEGCTKHNVPKESWHRVAEHYMAPKARARLDELHEVMAKVHGGKYKWNWEKYSVAMKNMGWDIDPKMTKTVKMFANSLFSRGSSGIREESWTRVDAPKEMSAAKDKQSLLGRARPASRRATTDAVVMSPTSSKSHKSSAAPSSKSSAAVSTKSSKDSLKTAKKEVKPPKPPKKDSEPLKPKEKSSKAPPTAWSTGAGSVLTRSNSIDKVLKRTNSIGDKMLSRSNSTDKASTPRPNLKSRSTTELVSPGVAASMSSSSGAVANPNPIPTELAQLPVWLLNATNALDFLSSEHPKVMSTISAILITVGSIPAIPAIAAGAGGPILASGAAHAVGAIAVGIGSWLKTQSEVNAGQQQGQQAIEKK